LIAALIPSAATPSFDPCAGLWEAELARIRAAHTSFGPAALAALCAVLESLPDEPGARSLLAELLEGPRIATLRAA
jgi:hypothetical protein